MSLRIVLSNTAGYYPQRLFFSIYFPYKKTNSVAKHYLQMFLTFASTSILMEALNYPLNKWRTLVYSHIAETNTRRPRILSLYFKKESIFSLWRGISLSYLHQILQNGLFCLSLYTGRELLGLSSQQAVFLSAFAAGAIVYPIDTAVKRIQNDSLISRELLQYGSISGSIRSQRQHMGLAGFYRGFSFFLLTHFLMIATFARFGDLMIDRHFAAKPE
jgi:hypothetical protein